MLRRVPLKEATVDWIAKDDRLPECYGRGWMTVLVCDSKNQVSAAEFWEEDGQFWNGKGEHWGHEDDDVVYWAYLPEGPGT